MERRAKFEIVTHARDLFIIVHYRKDGRTYFASQRVLAVRECCNSNNLTIWPRLMLPAVTVYLRKHEFTQAAQRCTASMIRIEQRMQIVMLLTLESYSKMPIYCQPVYLLAL